MPLLTIRTEPEKNFRIVIDGAITDYNTPYAVTLDVGVHTVRLLIPTIIMWEGYWAVKEWRDALGNVIGGPSDTLSVDLTGDMEVVAYLEWKQPLPLLPLLILGGLVLLLFWPKGLMRT